LSGRRRPARTIVKPRKRGGTDAVFLSPVIVIVFVVVNVAASFASLLL
jgi:hypothetical protein